MDDLPPEVRCTIVGPCLGRATLVCREWLEFVREFTRMHGVVLKSTAVLRQFKRRYRIPVSFRISLADATTYSIEMQLEPSPAIKEPSAILSGAYRIPVLPAGTLAIRERREYFECFDRKESRPHFHAVDFVRQLADGTYNHNYTSLDRKGNVVRISIHPGDGIGRRFPISYHVVAMDKSDELALDSEDDKIKGDAGVAFAARMASALAFVRGV
jgi:hypothetical protein